MSTARILPFGASRRGQHGDPATRERLRVAALSAATLEVLEADGAWEGLEPAVAQRGVSGLDIGRVAQHQVEALAGQLAQPPALPQRDPAGCQRPCVAPRHRERPRAALGGHDAGIGALPRDRDGDGTAAGRRVQKYYGLAASPGVPIP